jgi:aldose sugar dehydrogenase
MGWQRTAVAATLLAACSGGDGQAPPVEPGNGGPVAFRVATVVEGLEHPWGMAFLPGSEGILVTERPGRLRLVRDGSLHPEPVTGVPQLRAQGQGGLLDVALHPDFASNRLVYLSYSKPGPQGATTAVARGRLEGGRLTGVEDIFVADAWASGSQHFGSRLAFGADGMLYVTVGERGLQAPARDPSNHVGSTVRLHDDGRVPDDNPFRNRSGARPETYAIGQRNVQAMAVHPATGEVWQADHGPRGGDALNVLRAGADYGWPDFNFGNHYDGRGIPDPPAGSGIQRPVAHWTPAIAPSGMMVYSGQVFPQWRGDLFVGSLVGQHLRRVRVNGGEVVEQERLLDGRRQRIRAVAEGPDGMIYLLVDAPSAPLLRLEPAN